MSHATVALTAVKNEDVAMDVVTGGRPRWSPAISVPRGAVRGLAGKREMRRGYWW
jgi:hypothetical protein